VHTNGEETSVRGRSSGRGGRRIGWGGAPWWHRACCRVGGWGNDQSRLPPARHSRMKMMAGKSRGSALLAGTAGRLLV
jgi:hypothetical protein